MWKKTEPEDIRPDLPSIPEPPQPPARTRELATIGPSISIRGELSGEEDLIVQGRVEGTIDLQQNNVTVGKEGRVKADIKARTIKVEGEVEGKLRGDEQVIIRRSGNVRGDIVTPRAALEDGCRFKGTIDMDAQSIEKAKHPLNNVSDLKPTPPANSEPEKTATKDKPDTQVSRGK
jgi:cytoskeletal protein CcmA (bactofilin family)